jgi:hypothetical protein
VYMRVWITLFSALILGTICGAGEAVSAGDPTTPIASPVESIENIRAILKYLWPVLSPTRKAGRIYYQAICPPNGNDYPLMFPKIDARPPSVAGTELANIRSIFLHAKSVSVTADKSGLFRVRIGKIPDTILQTRIASLSFDADSQYNYLSAIGAIESAPEVQSAMATIGVDVPARVYHYGLVQPAAGLPHLPAQIADVTMDQALDMVARTWRGVVFYGACTVPGTYEIFFADGYSFDSRF